jgi:hypothetical protein
MRGEVDHAYVAQMEARLAESRQRDVEFIESVLTRDAAFNKRRAELPHDCPCRQRAQRSK